MQTESDKAKLIEQLSADDYAIGKRLGAFDGGDIDDALMIQHLILKRQRIRQRLKELRSED